MLVSLKKQKAKWVITYRNLATVESHQDASKSHKRRKKERTLLQFDTLF